MRISAVTLSVTCMSESVRFYQRLGLRMHRGGEDAPFTTFELDGGHLNLRAVNEVSLHPADTLVIFEVDDVDRMYRFVLTAGLHPEFAPQDAVWGERYFHMNDPDGHRLSFVRPLNASPSQTDDA